MEGGQRDGKGLNAIGLRWRLHAGFWSQEQRSAYGYSSHLVSPLSIFVFHSALPLGSLAAADIVIPLIVAFDTSCSLTLNISVAIWKRDYSKLEYKHDGNMFKTNFDTRIKANGRERKPGDDQQRVSGEPVDRSNSSRETLDQMSSICTAPIPTV